MVGRKTKLEQLYKATNVEIKDYTLEELLENKDGKNVIADCGYQREYMWDNVEASYLVETVLIDSLIPPCIIMEDKQKRVIIDGKQRYESLLRFYQNRFKLREKGLTKLKDLYGISYKDLPENSKTVFKECRIKALCYIADSMSLTEKDKETLQRDIYIRYNFGKTPLKLAEVGRAQYLYDLLTQEFIMFFQQYPDIYQECVEMFLPKTKKIIENEREKINLLMSIVRQLLSTPYIPIMQEKSINIGNKVVNPYYSTFFGGLSKQEREGALVEFKKIINKLSQIKEKLIIDNHELQDNTLFYKTAYWMFAILYRKYSNEFYQFNIDKLCRYLEDSGTIYFNSYNSNTRNNIRERYEYLGDYIQKELKLNLSLYIKEIKENKSKTCYKRQTEVIKDKIWKGMQGDKRLIAKPGKMTMEEIIKRVKEKRFIIQSAYQRAEVKDIRKASKIIESMIWRIKLPPIYLYETLNPENELSVYTVMDGQQRLISALAYMGVEITNEKGESFQSNKHKFALIGLEDEEGLNGYKYEGNEDKSLNPEKKKILESYPFDVVIINERGNEKFDYADLFVRVNQNNSPLSNNCFEMWNAFQMVNALKRIKEIAKDKVFKQPR